MLGIDRSDEPEFETSADIIDELKMTLFEYIDCCGLTMPEIMEVVGDYDAYYHGDRGRPDYPAERKEKSFVDLEMADL